MSFAGTPLGQGRRLDHSTFLGKPASRDRSNLASYSYGAPPLGSRSPPKLNPERWHVKDTSVNIAGAFSQAADEMLPNQAWASGANRPVNVPRSTSVEYQEQENSLARRQATSRVNKVPDDSLQQIRNHIPPVTFLARQRDENEIVDVSRKSTDDSYDYNEESHEVAKRHIAPRRGRLSADNKAYKPTQSDLEESSDYSDDDGKVRRRKKKKREAPGGPLTSLPTVGPEKRRKKRKGQMAAAEEDELLTVDELPPLQPATSRPPSSHGPYEVQISTARLSRPPSVARGMTPLGYQPPPPETNTLNSIEEVSEFERSFELDEANLPEPAAEPEPKYSSGIGYLIGRPLNLCFRIVVQLLFLFGRFFGAVFTLLILRPYRMGLFPYLFISIVVCIGYLLVADGDFRLPAIPWSRRTLHPPADYSEFSERLLHLESVITSLAQQDDVYGRIGDLEHKIKEESARVLDTENTVQNIAREGLGAVQKELEALRAKLAEHQEQQSQVPVTLPSPQDDEARAKLHILEERVGSVEVAIETQQKSSSSGSWWKSAKSSISSEEISRTLSNLLTHDIVSKPDYALATGGARVIPSLTSKTYTISPKSPFFRALGFFTGGNGYAEGRPPVTALHYDSHSGMCWPFDGSHGQLGVVLARPVRVHEITIDHLAREVAFDRSSAPREMEVWALAEGASNREKLAVLFEQRDRALAEAAADSEDAVVSPPAALPPIEEMPSSVPRSQPYIRIAAFTYDIEADNNVQTFSVFPEIRELDMDFGVALLVVKSNWGREEFTCLYRFRVHGAPLEESAPSP